MATTEEFSFPTTTDTPPRFLESPPLWHRSSSTSSRHEPPQRKSPKGDDHHNHRKSFSYVERAKQLKEEEEDDDDDDDDREEERMDVLWEDFMNEEVSKSTCGSALEFTDISSGRRPNNIGCEKVLKLSKSDGTTAAAGFSGKKPSVVVFVKLLKKMFLLQNSQTSVKKRTR